MKARDPGGLGDGLRMPFPVIHQPDHLDARRAAHRRQVPVQGYPSETDCGDSQALGRGRRIFRHQRTMIPSAVHEPTAAQMIVLAHRGNIEGPDPRRENTLGLLEEALARGFGLETDVRYAARHGFYISHDPALPVADSLLAAHAALWRRHPAATIALNIKELGQEAALVEALNALGVASQVFLFDMELIEPDAGETARTYRRLDPAVRLAARASDRGEPVERALGIAVAESIWLDEFDGPWATADTVRMLKDAGKAVFAVSPELHGRSLAQMEQRWRDFVLWGVDGVCTDWPARLVAQHG